MAKPEFLNPVNEAKAVTAIREALGAEVGDEALLTDMIEGETTLFEAVDVVLERIRDAEVGISGCKLVEATLSARRVRFEQNQKRDREILAQAMAIAELKTIARPTATLTLSDRAPAVIITEESEIPADYWKPADPVLDKKKLTEAMRERAEAMKSLPKREAYESDEGYREALAKASAALPPDIPGAVIANGAPSLTIRVK